MSQPINKSSLLESARRLRDAAIVLEAAAQITNVSTQFKLLCEAHADIKVYGEESVRQQLEIARNSDEGN